MGGVVRSIFGGGGGGGGSPPPAPVIMAPPPPPEILDVIDEVTGVKTFTAIDPQTGKKIRKIEALPRTAEEQRRFEEAGDLMDRSIAEMKRLNTYDPSQVVNYAPYINVLTDLNQERTADMERLTKIPDFSGYINEFTEMRQRVLDDEFQRASNGLREDLVRSGYGNSTGASEMRSALAGEQAKANQQLGVDSLAYGQQLYDQDLSRRSNEYNLRESTRMGRQASAEAGYNLQKDYAQGLEDQRQRSLQHQQLLYNIGSSIRGAETTKKMNSLAPKMALAEFGETDRSQMNRYNGDVNRQMINYQNQLAQFNSRRPSWSDRLLQGGVTLGTSYLLGGGGSSVGSGWANSLGNVTRSNPSYPRINANQVGMR